MKPESVAIINAVKEICKSGTKIVSFNYRGKFIQNVLIGSKRSHEITSNLAVAGELVLNRGLFVNHLGKYSVYGMENNNLRHTMYFDLNEIANFSYVRPHHFVAAPTFLERIKIFFRGWGLARMW